MTYSRPAGVEAFKKCPMTGCFISVWGPIWGDNYCREHGGTTPIQLDDDEYGNPRASEADPPRPRLAPLEA